MLTRSEREALFSRCFTSTQNADYATGWFLHATPSTLYRGNVIEWILWALYNSHGAQPGQKEWDEELDSYIKLIEKLLGRKLEDGYNEAITCLKVTMDPVVGIHRPFVWYMVRASDCL